MKKKDSSLTSIITSFVLVIIIFIVFFTYSPYNLPVPHRDSGMFLYTGDEILSGKVLYVDFWDHKQPLIFLINALGLLLGNNSPWGVWTIEFLLLSVTLVSFFGLIKQVLPAWVSLVVTTLGLLSILRMMGGNYTEEYAVCFQLLSLIGLFEFYFPAKKERNKIISAFLIGISSGIAFCFKQTYIDLTFTIFLFITMLLIIKRSKKIARDLLVMIAGFLTVNLILVLYFAHAGALRDYWLASFAYNRYYSNKLLLDWAESILEVLGFTTSNPIFFIILTVTLVFIIFVIGKMRVFFRYLSSLKFIKWFALALSIIFSGLFMFARLRGETSGMGLAESLLLFFTVVIVSITISISIKKFYDPKIDKTLFNEWIGRIRDYDWERPNVYSFLSIGCLDFLTVFFLIAVSGKGYSHYYVSYLPSILLLMSGTIMVLVQKIKPSRLLPIGITAFFIVGSFNPIYQVVTTNRNFAHNPSGNSFYESAMFLKNQSTNEAKILVWGYDSVIYFLSQRESPTRYFFQYPAYLESPLKNQIQETIFSDLKNKPPEFIVDVNSPTTPFLEISVTGKCTTDILISDSGIQKIADYVCENYSYVKTFDTIDVYQKNN
jgi:hypothetical protein